MVPSIDRMVDGGIIVSIFALGAAFLCRTKWLSSMLLLSLAATSFAIVNAMHAVVLDRPGELRAQSVDAPTLVSIEGVVIEEPIVHEEGRARAARRGVEVSMAAGEDGARLYRLDLVALPFKIRVGDHLRVRGWLEPDPEARNPGAFDARQWRERQSLLGRVEVEDPALVTRIDPPARQARGAGDRLRLNLAGGLRAAIPSSTDPIVRDMIVTMTIGSRGPRYSEVRALFSRTGLSHFIVISGFHLTMLAALMLMAARRAGAGPRLCGLALAIASLGFLAILESHVSVTRAGMTGLLAACAMMLARDWPAVSILALATSAMLVVDPEAAREAAFQLSFGAVMALLLLARPIERCLRSAAEALLAPRSWIVHRFDSTPVQRRSVPHPDAFRRVALARLAAPSVAAAIAAWLVTTPITLHHFGQVALWAVPGSVLLAPLASAITVLGIPAAIAGAWLPALAPPFSWPLAACAWFFVAMVEVIAILPGACVQRGFQPGWWTLAMVAIPLLVAVFRSWPWCLALALLWCMLASHPWWPAGAPHLEITALDLGGGRCVIVREGSATAMIDAGSPSGGSAGSRVIVPALATLLLTRVNNLVLTRRALASMSAVPEVIQAVAVDTVIITPALDAAPDRTAPARLLRQLDDLGLRVVRISGAQSLVIEPGLAIGAAPIHDGSEVLGVEAMDDDTAMVLRQALERSERRGARRWRRDPLSGWQAERWTQEGWRGTHPWEQAPLAR